MKRTTKYLNIQKFRFSGINFNQICCPITAYFCVCRYNNNFPSARAPAHTHRVSSVCISIRKRIQMTRNAPQQQTKNSKRKKIHTERSKFLLMFSLALTRVFNEAELVFFFLFVSTKKNLNTKIKYKYYVRNFRLEVGSVSASVAKGDPCYYLFLQVCIN